MRSMRLRIDTRSRELRRQGEAVLDRLHAAYQGHSHQDARSLRTGTEDACAIADADTGYSVRGGGASLFETNGAFNFFGMLKRPIPYEAFKARLEENRQ